MVKNKLIITIFKEKILYLNKYINDLDSERDSLETIVAKTQYVTSDIRNMTDTRVSQGNVVMLRGKMLLLTKENLKEAIAENIEFYKRQLK